MVVHAPLFTFPPITWWAIVLPNESISFNIAHPFEKMSMFNRYRVSGANNPILLTLPLVKGRDQKTNIGFIALHNAQNWQLQHWRTLTSVYRRTPYWEYYEPEIKSLFANKFESLVTFNLAAFSCMLKCLKKEMDIQTTNFSKQNSSIFGTGLPTQRFPEYYQVFESKIGFQANLSILDLLFSLGPSTTSWISERMPTL